MDLEPRATLRKNSCNEDMADAADMVYKITKRNRMVYFVSNFVHEILGSLSRPSCCFDYISTISTTIFHHRKFNSLVESTEPEDDLQEQRESHEEVLDDMSDESVWQCRPAFKGFEAKDNETT